MPFRFQPFCSRSNSDSMIDPVNDMSGTEMITKTLLLTERKEIDNSIIHEFYNSLVISTNIGKSLGQIKFIDDQ